MIPDIVSEKNLASNIPQFVEPWHLLTNDYLKIIDLLSLSVKFHEMSSAIGLFDIDILFIFITPSRHLCSFSGWLFSKVIKVFVERK